LGRESGEKHFERKSIPSVSKPEKGLEWPERTHHLIRGRSVKRGTSLGKKRPSSLEEVLAQEGSGLKRGAGFHCLRLFGSGEGEEGGWT